MLPDGSVDFLLARDLSNNRTSFLASKMAVIGPLDFACSRGCETILVLVRPYWSVLRNGSIEIAPFCRKLVQGHIGSRRKDRKRSGGAEFFSLGLGRNAPHPNINLRQDRSRLKMTLWQRREAWQITKISR